MELSTQRREKAIQPEVKLHDFVKILKAIEGVLQASSGDKGNLIFIQKLRSILNQYRTISGKEFLDLLEASLSTNIKKQSEVRKALAGIQVDLGRVSFNELRDLFRKNTLSKEQLLIIAEKRLGLSKGTLRKMKKEEVQNQMESAIQNIETLEVIRRKAGQ